MSHPYTYPESEHSWYVQYTYGLLKKVFGPIVRLIWIKHINGIGNIPIDGPVIIAFNHQSYFDFLCFIAVCTRPIHFLSAEKFFVHKFWSPLMKLTGQIKVHRHEHDKHILHTTVHDHLKNNKVIGIFPEGTRSPHLDEMLHAFTGVARYAVIAKVPVIPVGIIGTYEIMSLHDSVPKFKKAISINIGKPIHFTEHYDRELPESELREITDIIMMKISGLSGKNYGHVGKVERENKIAKLV